MGPGGGTALGVTRQRWGVESPGVSPAGLPSRSLSSGAAGGEGNQKDAARLEPSVNRAGEDGSTGILDAAS